MNDRFADIIVDITHEKIDRTFQYKIPESLQGILKVGDRVQVLFGMGNRRITGFVIQITDTPSYDIKKMKEICRIDTGQIPLEAKLIPLAAWIRKTYGSTMIQALKTVIPVKQKMKAKEQRRIVLQMEKEAAKKLLETLRSKNQKARIRLLEALMKQGSLDYSEAVRTLSISAEVIRYFEDQGILRLESRQIYRNPFEDRGERLPLPPLSEEQQSAVRDIRKEWKKEQPRPCLLYGVTGSGKTRVYMELIKQVLEQGQQVIVLIPEIALTWQTVSRFTGCFGQQVSVMHSQMSPGERSDQIERAKKGEIRIMIGPRSALFTPFESLGLIIIDEEHETSYQSEQTPCYHARETAVCRAELEGARVVMGSATPSLEARYRCSIGEYYMCRLEQRFGDARLPQVDIVDLREELRTGNRSILSRNLQQSMEECLNRKEQIMLFLNRRGYVGFISCRSCGHVVKCPHCDVSLTVHNNGTMVCHYCGYETRQITRCPSCHSPYIGGFRAGTQQIEKLVKERFPGAGVLRMDRDTTRNKGEYESILTSFAEGGADILIGTQMIVKGHDFPGVTLVGVLAADLSLFASDYRASERTFQLITQAVGRSGRGAKKGRAIIQTYQPEHYSIRSAAVQDYDAFYEEEIAYRCMMSYPPASNLMAVHGSCEDEAVLAQAMEYIRRYLIRIGGENLFIIGPASEPLARKKDRYQMVLYIKEADPLALIRLREKLEQYIEINKGFQKIYIQFDLNA